jgi:hypothetical protein
LILDSDAEVSTGVGLDLDAGVLELCAFVLPDECGVGELEVGDAGDCLDRGKGTWSPNLLLALYL